MSGETRPKSEETRRQAFTSQGYGEGSVTGIPTSEGSAGAAVRGEGVGSEGSLVERLAARWCKDFCEPDHAGAVADVTWFLLAIADEMEKHKPIMANLGNLAALSVAAFLRTEATRATPGGDER